MLQQNLIEELSQNFIDYAAEVNEDRAIPDAKSGLKPVATRILWSALEKNRTSKKPHVKSARVVGDVMGAYHPHGDSSIYEAMVRLSQDWVMRYPLLDFHGNNGAISGDGAAAQRYTEVRLSSVAEDGLLTNLKKRNVDFKKNYDGTLDEPVTLPSIFPNLLCNPNKGIGVSIACSWLPHNLKEVASAIFDYIAGKEPVLLAPDFPTGGLIVNGNELKNIITTGKGTVKVRSRYKVDKQNLIFYELPYRETIDGVMESIADACEKNDNHGIDEIRDETTKKGIRIVIVCEKNKNPDAVAAWLFKNTKLQTSLSYNQVAVLDKTPMELGLKDCCKIYVDHNIDCLLRETEYDLNKAKERLHIVTGLLKALQDIDAIIKTIKESADAASARVSLIEKYSFTEIQAKSILSMKLSSLANLEKVELNQEKEKLDSRIGECGNILTQKDKQLELIQKKLNAIVELYGDDRRTEIAEGGDVKDAVEEEHLIWLEGDKLKKVSKDYSPKPKERIIQILPIKSNQDVTIFTSCGRCYKVKAFAIPATDIPFNSLVQTKEETESIVSIFVALAEKTNKKIIFGTQKGMIKQTALAEYQNISYAKKGSVATTLKLADDKVSSVSLTDTKAKDVVLITNKGKGLKISLDSVSTMGKAAGGIKGIILKESDYLVSAIASSAPYLAIVETHNHGKVIDINTLELKNKGGQGVYITNSKNADIIGAFGVEKKDSLLLLGDKKHTVVPVSSLPFSSKTAQGNKLSTNNTLCSVKILL